MSLQTLKECPHSLLSSPHFLFCPQSTQSGLQSYPVEAILCKIMNEKLQSLVPELVCPLCSIWHGSSCPLSGNLSSSDFPKTPLSFCSSPHSWSLRTHTDLDRELKTSSLFQPWEWNLGCESITKWASSSEGYTLGS